MSSPLLIPVGYQFFGNDGKPLASGNLYTYVAGTGFSSIQNTYSDDGLTVLNPNPIPLNAAGRCVVSGTEVNVYPTPASYGLVLKDSTGTTVWSHDFVDPAAPFNILTNVTLNSPTINTPTITSPTIKTSVISSSALFNGICQGRLTLTSGVPVTTSDVTGALTIFFTPYGGRNIALYDGTTNWTLLPFVETSLPLGILTSGLPYDVFAFNNNGTLALESLAWSNTTTRATALVLQDGVYSKTGVLTRRYLGTFFTTSTTQTEDSATKRYLWNYYNRMQRQLRVIDTTDNWSYNTAAYRQANNSTANQVNVVVGLQEVMLYLSLSASSIHTTTGTGFSNAIGTDSVTVASGTFSLPQSPNPATLINLVAQLGTYPAVGRHFYAWLEFGTGSGTDTWYGDNGGTMQSGMDGWIEG